MSEGERRTVGERGQITLPKGFREAYNIRGGDEVVVRDDDGRLVIEKPVTREDLAKGYRQRAERDAALADEFNGVSTEANEELGDAPDW
ncbi:AbrB/MazE/SpoVT family DNA-binding domain-containing protein [Halobacterium salinarum]|uniref:AbrB/MazE/SpoVT family DNA-binding domain-containing protein n=1 Tax=Halobacterium salinarum TaxID=2242 RepID=UPI002552ED0A|nr:AbrB/MazE/SpoVT family DNA-binding domain-containing protein [Halobacterium salinarum]MDL0134382.1 AbrB/MazE/SpoVT family DNA-binding domain-containing protein [Halobacterium salinarum]